MKHIRFRGCILKFVCCTLVFFIKQHIWTWKGILIKKNMYISFTESTDLNFILLIILNFKMGERMPLTPRVLIGHRHKSLKDNYGNWPECNVNDS